MNDARLKRLEQAATLANLANRLHLAPLVLVTLADGSFCDYEDETRTFADLGAYRAAYGLRADEGPLVIMPYVPEREAEAAI